MAEKILIIAGSGMGKSTSMKNLDSSETVLIRCVKKPLPFEGWKKKYKAYNKETKEGNLFDISNADNIVKCIKFVANSMPHIKQIIVDDSQYIMGFEFMERAKEKGFEKFTDIGKNFFNVVMCPDDLRDDLFVVFLSHSEDVSANGYMITKIKTIGKMLDEKITIEGLFTVVLQASKAAKGKDEVEHFFITQSDGTTTAKSPMGMFDSKYIDNDLDFVIKRIREYNGE